MGYCVHVQDVAMKPINDLAAVSRENGLDISINVGNASEHLLAMNYDAILCLRVLHFMESSDAWTVLENMKSHTKLN